MALIVEDGTGLANADSLISLAYLKAHQLDLGVDLEQDDEVLEPLIRKASTFISTSFNWNGTPVSGRAQAFPFPMQDLVDKYGSEVDASSVPTEVQQAVSAAVAILIDNPTAFNPASSSADGNVQMTTLAAKGLEKTVQYFEPSSTASATVVPKLIVDLLYGLGTIKNVGGDWVGSFNHVRTG